MNTESCDMHRVDRPEGESCWDTFDHMQPGDFFFDKSSPQVRFYCILPGGHNCVIPIRPLINPAENGGHSWDWDLNEDAPTLNPSINSIGTWHGWIRAGRMVSC